ncbi:MAG: sigma-70 family RNA polymerase sigma factor [Bacteroidetes bacterium]|jgi:RNA polymerase sigma-70 factor (ECF subfamily)|nr:sigma-70 family RNA polymerase sigma factor [Bacteroidota bacterium]
MNNLEEPLEQRDGDVAGQDGEQAFIAANSHIRNSLDKQGRDSLFQKEFLPHMDSMYNFGFYLANDEELAKDLLQETYLKAYKYIEYFQVGTNSKAWLIRIMKNNFINEYRKKSKAPYKVDIEDVNQKEDIEDGFVELDMRQEVFGSLIGDEITNAVNALPVDYRLIILLCDIEGFKYDEIATIIDVPLGTVRSRLHRARNLLKENLKEYAKSRGYNVN